MLRAGVKDLDAILFTHEHKDHIAGLDDIRPFNYLLHKRERACPQLETGYNPYKTEKLLEYRLEQNPSP